jgi:tetratricopeptide (TPR) repeat protein
MDDLAARHADGLMAYAVFWTEQKRNLESAEQTAEMALRMFPESAYILREAAKVYFGLGKPDKALAVFGPSFVAKNRDKVRELRYYTLFWAGQGTNLGSALEAARRIVELMPAAWTYDNLSLVYLKMKDYQRALEFAEKAVELADERSVSYYRPKVESIRKLMKEKDAKAA